MRNAHEKLSRADAATAKADLIFAKALDVLRQLDGLSYADAARVLEVARCSMADSVNRLHAEQVFSPPAFKEQRPAAAEGQEVTYV